MCNFELPLIVPKREIFYTLDGFKDHYCIIIQNDNALQSGDKTLTCATFSSRLLTDLLTQFMSDVYF